MKEKIFQNRLKECLKQFKDNIAIQYGRRFMTYKQLDEESDRIARWIIEKGISRQTFIGILTDDRMDLITVITGTLKAGCIIVPLYSAYPTERLKSMIDVIRLECIFIDGKNADRFKSDGMPPGKGTPFIPVEDLHGGNGGLNSSAAGKPEVDADPEDPLYVHFTSGTTGIPKAIVGKNKSLLHFLQWEIEAFTLGSKSRVAQFTIPGFDPFLRDVFAPLLAGGTICAPEDKDVVMDADALKEWVDNNRITLIHCVPSLFRLLSSGTLSPGHFKSLEAIMLAGEKINPSDLVDWYDVFGERIRLANCYGPTETTMSKACYFIRQSDVNRERIPIGKPIKGADLIILDEEMNICDSLEEGDIYIRTPYRSCGYYNDPVLNREKFIPNPFNDDPNDILYKSGDLGRVLLDGNIDILGRVDRQVKIRGYRVELEEIETLLVSHPSIREAVVVKREDPAGGEMLCAYVTLIEKGKKAEENDEFTNDLREYLLLELPAYMVPTLIMRMDDIPRRATGKVDFDRLPDIFLELEKKYVPPGNDIERRLYKLWNEILGIEKISIHDRFIHLGGNSLNIMSLVSKIHREFDIRISLGEIFKNPTIRMQAGLIGGPKLDKYASIEKVEEKEYYVLSSAQKRIYIVHQLEPESTAYNMPQIVLLEGELEREKLAEIFRGLIQRHDSLRTSFISLDGPTVHKIHDRVDFEIEYYSPWGNGYSSLEDEDAAFEAAINEAKNRFVRPFDLSGAPLLRVGLVKIGETRHILMVDMHHIISDGVSHAILTRDFIDLYRGRKLLPLPLQYKDFTEWEYRRRESGQIKKQEEYWLNRFKGELPILTLPTDYPRPLARSFDDGGTIDFTLEKSITEKLHELVIKTDTTIFVVLLAIYNVLLFKITGQEDITVGSSITGRSHADLQNVIGVFVNMLAMRNLPGGEKTFLEFLEEVKENALNAFENQDYPFDELVNKLRLQGDNSRNPLFDTEFAMNNMEIPEVEIPGLKLEPYDNGVRFAKFDLHFTVVDRDDIIDITLRYSTALYKKSTVCRITEHYIEIAGQLAADLEIKLKNISISHDFLSAQSNIIEEVQGDFEI